MRTKAIWVVVLISSLIFGLAQCYGPTENPNAYEVVAYLNHNDTVKYVGIETCKQCHYDIYQSFVHTGMGSSFGVADSTKSVAHIHEHSILEDVYHNLNYHPYWLEDSLYLEEFRVVGNDTTYKKTQRIDYVIGSGQHTNSHLYEVNGYLYQAPFTWYAQKGKLDFPPGFEDGNNTRFSRKIGLECSSCHNAMPEHFQVGSINKYKKIPAAIDCERCHGPGEAHVKKIQRGDITDTSKYIDNSIVNIKKLPTELQFETCMRCHLQGNTVLAEGKTFLDFKPGMKLSEVMDVYLPRYKGAEDQFIMASHVDRFKQSKCFIESAATFNCTSCHNPHVSVKFTKQQQFNNSCASCHQGEPKHECTNEEALLAEANYNCVSCHMPASGSIDIPHVSVHDHKIQIPEPKIDMNNFKVFLGLAAINNVNPSNKSKAKAYLQQYERFEAKPFYLDSAEVFISRLGEKEDNFKLWVHLYYLKKDFTSISALEQNIGITKIAEQLHYGSPNNEDAWTAYRIGQSIIEDASKAVVYIDFAVDRAPYISEFRLKLASLFMSQGKQEDALKEYSFVLREEPKNKEALNNLGFIKLKQGKLSEGAELINKALAEDPDYELAWLNMTTLYMLQEDNRKAIDALGQVLRINPGNKKALETRAYLLNSR